MDSIRIPWNDWKVVRQLGKGSYGTVYEIERALGSYTEKAALKVIPIPPDRQIIIDAYSDGYDDASVTEICESYLNNTLNEYKTMRSMSGNTNIVSCDDIASLPTDDNIGWEVFIRMELLTCFTDYLRTVDEFDESEIIKLGKDICYALIVCDKNNVVHRDVKPNNIFVTPNGDYKLGDFGVARTLDHATTATRVGTDRFIAPEVIKRDKYGKDVDIYSLGLVLYWLLNDRKMPFITSDGVPKANEYQEAYNRRVSGETLPEPKHGTQSFKKLVLKACAYDRANRFQSAKEMLQALKAVEKEYQELENLKTEHSDDNSQLKHYEISLQNENDIDNGTSGNSWEDDSKTIPDPYYQKTANNASIKEIEEDKTISGDWIKKTEETEKSDVADIADEPVIDGVPSEKKEESDKEEIQKGKEDKGHIPIKIKSYSEFKELISQLKNYLLPKLGIFFRKFKSKKVIAIILLIVLIVGIITASVILYDDRYLPLSGGIFFERVEFGGIEWIVLDEEGEKTLLLSKDCIEERAYNEKYESVTWETCTLRSFLNDEWFEDTFSDEEKNMVLTTYVENSDNSETETSGGNDTEDKVFLLSIEEVKHYFSSDYKRVAKYHGKTDWWWLRSPGYSDYDAAAVLDGGDVDYGGDSVNCDYNGIRPALWVNLNS